MRPVAVLRFSPTEGPAYFAEWLDRRGIAWTLVPLDAGAARARRSARLAGIAMMGGPMSVNDDEPWVAPVCALAARRRSRQRGSGHRSLPRRAVARQGARCAGDARAGRRDRLGRRPGDRCRTRNARGSAAATASRRSSGTTTRSRCRRARRACSPTRFNANQAYVVDDRHIGLPVPHRDDARSSSRRGSRAARTSCQRHRAAPCRRADDIRRDLDGADRRAARASPTTCTRAGRPGCRIDHADPRAVRSPDQPDRRRRGRRAAGVGAEGAPRERARLRRDADRRRPRGRRHRAHSRGRQRRAASSARSSHSRSRGTRRRSSRAPTISRRSPRWAFAARRWRRSARCRASRSRRAPPGKPHAWRIEVEGGVAGVTAPAAIAAGTTVTIHELYYNTPARRKFLRTEATEWGHCEEAFRRVALAHPDVGFTLQHNGRVVHRLLAQGRRARVEALLGDGFVEGAAQVDARAGPLAIAGYRGASRVRDAGGRPVHIRQRPLRARPRARARAARGVPRRAASRAPAGLRAVARRSIRGRSTSTCIRRRSRCAFANRAPCTSSSVTRSSARWRATGAEQPAVSAADRLGLAAAHAPPFAPVHESVAAPTRPWPYVAPRAGRDAARRRASRRRSTRGSSARDRRRPRTSRTFRRPPTTIRWASRSRSCTASTCSRRTATASSSSTCTRRTSGSSTSG